MSALWLETDTGGKSSCTEAEADQPLGPYFIRHCLKHLGATAEKQAMAIRLCSRLHFLISMIAEPTMGMLGLINELRLFEKRVSETEADTVQRKCAKRLVELMVLSSSGVNTKSASSIGNSLATQVAGRVGESLRKEYPQLAELWKQANVWECDTRDGAKFWFRPLAATLSAPGSAMQQVVHHDQVN